MGKRFQNKTFRGLEKDFGGGKTTKLFGPLNFESQIIPNPSVRVVKPTIVNCQVKFSNSIKAIYKWMNYINFFWIFSDYI